MNDKFKGKLIANRYVRRNKNPLPDKSSPIYKMLKNHVKRDVNGYLVLKQYDDAWYEFTFPNSHLSCFEDFYRMYIEPYFEIVNKDGLNFT